MTSAPTPVAPGMSWAGARIVVVNASEVGGSATAMGADLAADGYTVAPMAISTGPRLGRSIVYYLNEDPASLAVLTWSPHKSRPHRYSRCQSDLHSSVHSTQLP